MPISSLDQIEVERLTLGFQALSILKQDFSSLTSDTKLLNVLAKLWLMKSASVEALVAVVDKTNPQEAANYLETLVEEGWINLEQTIAGEYYFTPAFEPEEEIIRQCELFQFPLPIFSSPAKIKGMRDTSYHTYRKHVLTSQIDNTAEEQGFDLALDVLNYLAETRYIINFEALDLGLKHISLHQPKMKPDDTGFSYAKKKKMYRVFWSTSADVSNWIGPKDFCFSYRFDTRGRFYPTAYHLNPQGTKLHKAVLLFANGRKIPNV